MRLVGRITIIIPNYEGRQLLPRTLAHLEPMLGGGEERPDVIVVDDGSSDGSVEYLRKHHPDLRLLALESNRGFGGAVNAGVEAASTPLVYLMNSDVLPHEGFLEPLARRFQEDPQLFAAMSLNLDPAGHVSAPTQVSPRLRRGQIRVKGLDLESAWRAGTLGERGPIATLFGSGGSVPRAQMPREP